MLGKFSKRKNLIFLRWLQFNFLLLFKFYVMKNNKLLNIQPKLPQSIQDRIEEVLNEDEAYVADELVELCEAILNEIAALGFAHQIFKKLYQF